MDLYCVKCKTRTSTNDMMTVTTKNNRAALTGKCATCGVKKFKFISAKGIKKSEEVILQPNYQNSPEHHGESTLEKSISQDTAIAAPEHD